MPAPGEPHRPDTLGEPSAAHAVVETDLALPEARRGKVRDVYRLPRAEGGAHDRFLMVATDRLSAFDVVLPTPVPGKGRLLTEISAFWLRWIESKGLSPTHLLSTAVSEIPDEAFAGRTSRADLRGRVTIGRRCRVVPIECVARGYLEGSGWREYRHSGSVCGVRLPEGLRQCEILPEPVFTPATKAETGHDENISFERACEAVGRETMELLRDRTLAIYAAAAEHALARGIIIADTKFEFGVPIDDDDRPTGEPPVLIDEALTPDSSRFWPAEDYEPGRPQRSFDKQFVREFLERLVSQGRWDKTAPGPELPDDVVAGTLDRYRAARDLLMS